MDWIFSGATQCIFLKKLLRLTRRLFTLNKIDIRLAYLKDSNGVEHSVDSDIFYT